MRIAVIGALGEIGAHIRNALEQLGITVVPLTSRPGMATGEVMDVRLLPRMLSLGEVDTVVYASGPGDHRKDRDWQPALDDALVALDASTVPSILLSTIRVMEGATTNFADDAPPMPNTPYARANAMCEARWLESAPPHRSVLRLANVFARPNRPQSPQVQLLPWSLIEEVQQTSRLHVRSGAGAVKSFVDPADIARALLLLLHGGAPAITTTAPAFTVTLGDLSAMVARAFRDVANEEVSVSFGADEPEKPQCTESWLTRHGWRSELRLDVIDHEIHGWIQDRGLSSSSP